MFGLTNTASGGGKMETAPIAAYFGHGSTGESWITPSNYTRVSYDRDYFTYSNGVFTAIKDCDVVLATFTQAFHNQNTGSSNTGHYRVLVNGTSVSSGTAAISATSYSLKTGDTVQYQCHGSTTGQLAGGLGIRFAS